MANIKAQDLPEKLTKAVPDDRVLMIDSEDFNRLKTQPAEYYRGDDGVSPTVNVIDTPPGQEPAGHTVEITDVNGKKSFFVKDGGGDMEKAVYDKNDNGIVDDAEALGGRPAEDYALKEDVQDHINTKTFYIKGESDLTTAQEIFERFKQDKNPIVIYQNVSFNMSNLFNDRLEFMASKDLPYENSLCTPACMIYYSGNNVTSVKLRMLTAIDIKTINNETLLGQGNITIKGGAYEAPKIEIKLTPIQTVYKKGTTASISEFKATITKGTNDIESVRFKKDDGVIYIVTDGIKDGGDVVCNCGTALSNLTENTKLTVEVNDGDSTTVEEIEIAFVNPFYYGCSDTININNTLAFTEDISKKENKTYGFSPNWEHNTIIYDSSYGELLEIRDENGFRLDSGFTTGTFEEGTVNYRYYTETIETKDNDAVYTFYFTASGGGDNPPVTPTIAIDTALSTTSGNPVQNKVITTAMQGKQDILESGVNIKTINGNSLLGGGNIEIQGGTGDAYTKAETDTLLADKADKSDTYTKAEINEQMGNKVDSTAYNTAIQDLQDQIDTKANQSTTYTKTETDLLLNNKADAIDVYTKLETDDLLTDKQDTLVSGTNIKTINGNSLLGNGNIEIQGGTTISVDSELSDTSENPVQNKVIKQALDAKANTTDIPDVSNFATKSELPDMTDYYDKAEVDALIPDVSDFITKDVDNLTYYTKTADLPSVPTKTSELTNDSGFITSADIPAIPSKTSDLTNDSGFITNSVNNLTNYYTKTEIDAIINKMKEKCPCMRDGLVFTADEANSTISLNKVRTPTEANFEISVGNTTTWSDYTLGDTITLANVGDSVYIRNKSETVVGLSTNDTNYYKFAMTGKIKASGDVNYMLCKTSTDTLTEGCYTGLFLDCASLVQAPELPATNLPTGCYVNMFKNCSSLLEAPNLSILRLGDYCCFCMFYGCTSLIKIPSLPLTNLSPACYRDMFYLCRSLNQVTALPATTLTDECYRGMFNGCASIKLSETQTSEYTQPYRIPTSGTGTVGTSSLNNMFAYTGGTFKLTPTINTTYYLHKDNVIV